MANTRSQRLIRLAGFALILAGIFCLCLSGAVFTGWWQGTLDAFGVGFTVGGIVDVLAIFALNQSIAAEDRQRQENNQQARKILEPRKETLTEAQAREAQDLLWSSRGLIDPQLAGQLNALVETWHLNNVHEEALRLNDESITGLLADGYEEWRSPDSGDAPQAPGSR